MSFTQITFTQVRPSRVFLLSKQTHLVGTVRSKRINFPAELATEKLDKVQACFYVQSETPMIAMKYRSHKDNAGGKEKIVHVLYTCHQAEMEDVILYTRDGIRVKKSTAIKAYNIHMGDVDRVDQQLHTLQCLRKSYKWYRKLAFRLMMQMILNAHKIHGKEPGSKISFIDFVLEVVNSLIASLPLVPQATTVVPHDDFERLVSRHFPLVKKATDGASNQRPKKHCRVCYAKGKRTNSGKPLKTVYICKFCPWITPRRMF